MNDIAYALGLSNQEDIRPGRPGSAQSPLWVKSAAGGTTKGRGMRGSLQLLFEQATGGEGLDRAADKVESQS
jgi:hypothetical protein